MRQPPQLRQRTRVGPSGRAALELLACCPRMPADVMAVLLGHRRAVSTMQLLARLRRAGLVQHQAFSLGPLLGSRPVRLWTLTAAGNAFLTRRGLASFEHPGQLAYGVPERWREPARQRQVPLLVAAYRLLAEVATGLDRPVRVCAWEHPWVRTIRPTDRGRRRRVRLPAAAVLASRQTDDRQQTVTRVLLLPDIGTASLASYRPTLQALTDPRRIMRIDEQDEPVLIVGIATSLRSSDARVQAWRSLLRQVADRADERPLRARVLTLENSPVSCPDDTRRPPEQVDEVFALLARHPLLTRQQLASLLGTSTRRIGRLVAELVARGWLRPLASDGLQPAKHRPTGAQVQHAGLVELTGPGRREAARRLLVPAGLAGRRHGVLRSDSSRGRFLRQLHHTLGANAFFVDLTAAAARLSRRGADEALVEWRSAAACARGRFRPDGYGCYRRGPWRFGFFLEYDRGTERSSQYATKLATYYRYRDTGSYQRDYQTFPTVLVVTTSERAEARFAHQAYLAQQRYGGAPLPVFLTTIDRIRANPEGVLGSIWRAPGSDAWEARQGRVRWLPGVPGAPTARPALRARSSSGEGRGDEGPAGPGSGVAVAGQGDPNDATRDTAGQSGRRRRAPVCRERATDGQLQDCREPGAYQRGR